MSKKLRSFLIILLTLFAASCWIYPDYKDYKLEEDVYYFDDYETMKSVIIPLINKSFSTWHWSEEEFDKKYNMYFGNIEANENDNVTLSKTSYKYVVRTRATNSKVKPKEKDSKGTLKDKSISGEYFWITEKQKGSVIFYQN